MRSLKFLTAFLILILASLACFTTFDASGTEVTDPIIPRLTDDTGWWYDTTDRAPHDLMQQLEALSAVAEGDGWQIGGVIWSNSVSDPSQICTDFGNENGIGDKESDNGIAVCVFLDKEGDDGNAPYVFVAIGSGLEGLLPDSKVGWFLDTYMFPKRAEGNWEQGLLDLVDALHRYLSDPEKPEFNPPIPWGLIIAIVLLILLLVVLDISLTGGEFTMAIMSAAAKGGGGRFGGGGAGG